MLKKFMKDFKEGVVIGIMKAYLKKVGVDKPVVFINEPRIVNAALYSHADNTIVFCLPRMKEYQRALGLPLLPYLMLLAQDCARLVDSRPAPMEVSAWNN